MLYSTRMEENYITRQLVGEDRDKTRFIEENDVKYHQLSLFDDEVFKRENAG